MREFSLPVLYFQLSKLKDFFAEDLKSGYWTYSFLITETDFKFLDINCFQEYLITTKVEKDILLKEILEVCNEIIDLIIDNKLDWKEKDYIESLLPINWKDRLSDRMVNLVKSGYVCISVGEDKIHFFQKPSEIRAFIGLHYNESTAVIYFTHIITRVQKIRDLIIKYYPNFLDVLEVKQVQSLNSYPDIFKGNDNTNCKFFTEFLTYNEKDDLYNSVSCIVNKMKDDNMIIKDVSYKTILKFLENEELIPNEYERFDKCDSFCRRAPTANKRIVTYDTFKEKFRSSE